MKAIYIISLVICRTSISKIIEIMLFLCRNSTFLHWWQLDFAQIVAGADRHKSLLITNLPITNDQSLLWLLVSEIIAITFPWPAWQSLKKIAKMAKTWRPFISLFFSFGKMNSAILKVKNRETCYVVFGNRIASQVEK